MKLRVCAPIAFASLLASSCAGMELKVGTTGDFCDVARPLPYATNEVADFMADHDPRHVERDAAHNIYGERRCDWKF